MTYLGDDERLRAMYQDAHVHVKCLGLFHTDLGGVGGVTTPMRVPAAARRVIRE